MELVIAALIVFSFFSYFEPDFMFWVAVTLFLDPGGYLQIYLPRSMIGGLQLWDIQFLLLMIPLLSPKVKIQNYFLSRDNRSILLLLISFTVIYHVFIYGYVMTSGSFNSLYNFIQYERLTIIGFLSIIPAYIFFRRSYPTMIKFAFITSVIVSIFFIITLATNLSLVPLITMDRGLGISEQRLILPSYGYAWWFIPAAFTILTWKIKVPSRFWVYFICGTIITAILLTLTRRSIIELIYVVFLILFFQQLVKERVVITFGFLRIATVIIVVILLAFVAFPNYIQNFTILAEGIGNYFQQESISQISDGRLTFDIPQHIERFKTSPLFGYGYDALWYSNDTLEGGLSANDVPLTAALGMFGIAGLLFYSLFYLKLFGILYKCFKILKEANKNNIQKRYPHLFLILFIVLIFLIDRFTLMFTGYFGDLIQGEYRVRLMMYIGFLLAAKDLFSEFFQNRV